MPEATAAENVTGDVLPVEDYAARLRAVVAAANAGDKDALKVLRTVLEANPQIAQHCGNLSKLVEMTWLNVFFENDALGREALARQLIDLKASLLGPTSPTPLEKLAVDRVVACWLAVQHADMASATTGGSLGQAAFRLRRVESAQRRYVSAMKALATLRELESSRSR